MFQKLYLIIYYKYFFVKINLDKLHSQKIVGLFIN